jgi:hypothetical protein
LIIEQKTYGEDFSNKLIAAAEGQKYHTRPVRYRLTDPDSRFKDTEYTCIAGGLIWPTLEYPGYAIIVGVVEDGEKIHLLEEFKTEHIGLLYNYCSEAQERYGKVKFKNVLSTWWGNADKIMSLVHEREASKRLFITEPPDSEKEENFQIYLNRLITLSYKDNKVIKWGDCKEAKNSFLSLVKSDSLKKEHNPVIACTGWLIHAIIIYKPWRRATKRIDLIPTTTEEISEHRRKRAEKHMVREIMGGRKRFGKY